MQGVVLPFPLKDGMLMSSSLVTLDCYMAWQKERPYVVLSNISNRKKKDMNLIVKGE